jgi:hypothetical protein
MGEGLPSRSARPMSSPSSLDADGAAGVDVMNPAFDVTPAAPSGLGHATRRLATPVPGSGALDRRFRWRYLSAMAPTFFALSMPGMGELPRHPVIVMIFFGVGRLQRSWRDGQGNQGVQGQDEGRRERPERPAQGDRRHAPRADRAGGRAPREEPSSPLRSSPLVRDPLRGHEPPAVAGHHHGIGVDALRSASAPAGHHRGHWRPSMLLYPGRQPAPLSQSLAPDLRRVGNPARCGHHHVESVDFAVVRTGRTSPRPRRMGRRR